MRKEILLTFLAITLIIGSLSRLAIAGWFFIVGVLSIIIFGIIHIILHYNLIKYSSNLKRTDLILAGLSHILYLNLFLFQSDGGDDRSYVVIEYLLGEFSYLKLEQYAFAIFIASLILYFITTAILLFRLRFSSPTFSKKKLKIVTLSILFVIIIPIGFLYFSSKVRDVKDMKENEKSGKYSKIKRALRNKKNVKYLNTESGNHSFSEIPKDVFKLIELEELHMSLNSITAIPKEISLLKKLRILNLGYNQIKHIPDEIASLDSLRELYLSENFIDSINPKICDCKNLRELNISGKSLKNIPDCLSKMPLLEKLFIQSDSINNFMKDFEIFINLNELDLRTYGGALRDNQKLSELKNKLPKTRIYIPSSFKPNL